MLENLPIRTQRRYGWRPDLPDHRDVLLGIAAPTVVLPPVVSLRDQFPAPYDQGPLGCHDEATEVLTATGWTPWPEYDGTVAAGTVNPLTKALEFQVPTALHAYDYRGPMHSLDHSRLDVSLTPNHRMWVRRWNERDRKIAPDFSFVEMGNIGWYSGLLASPVGWEGVDLRRLQIGREYDGDDLLALVALIISDGWVGGTEDSRNVVSFCCFRDDRVEMVRALAGRLGIPEQPSRPGVWKWTDAPLAAWLRQNCYVGDVLRSPFKQVPQIVKEASGRQIALFLRYFGDQHVDRDGDRQFYTSSVKMADDLQDLLMRVGRRSGIYRRDPRDSYFPGGRLVAAENCVADITVTEWGGSNLSIDRKKHVQVESYSGGVFCATVPNGLLVTRRNGSILVSGNSCTANALAGLFEHRQTVERHDRPVTPSRLFVYYGERLIEGTVDSDAGAEIRDGIKVLAKVGAPPETAWPYDTSKFAVKPPVSVYKTATKFEAVRYARVPRDVRSMQSQLAKGNPFAFGFSVYASFESAEVARTGIVPLPTPGEELLGGHAVVAVGYKPVGSLLYFEVRNSWGAGWGDAGYFWLPAPYLNSRGLASDFWTVTSVSA